MWGAGDGDANKEDIRLSQSEGFHVQTPSHVPNLAHCGNKCTVVQTSCPAGEVPVLHVAWVVPLDDDTLADSSNVPLTGVPRQMVH